MTGPDECFYIGDAQYPEEILANHLRRKKEMSERPDAAPLHPVGCHCESCHADNPTTLARTPEPVAWRYRHNDHPGANWILTTSGNFFQPEKFEIQPLYAGAVESATWKKIAGWEYEVSSAGEVRRIGKTEPLKQFLRGYRYPGVSLWSDNKGTQFYTHRLVAEVFVSNPEDKLEVNHKDGNALNNDAANLEWVTRTENVAHNLEELGARGHTLDFDKANEIRRLHAEGVTKGALSITFNVSRDTIKDVVGGRTWVTASPPEVSEEMMVEPATCSRCDGETFVVEITRCKGCANEFYTREQSLEASRKYRLDAQQTEG